MKDQSDKKHMLRRLHKSPLHKERLKPNEDILTARSIDIFKYIRHTLSWNILRTFGFIPYAHREPRCGYNSALCCCFPFTLPSTHLKPRKCTSSPLILLFQVGRNSPTNNEGAMTIHFFAFLPSNNVENPTRNPHSIVQSFINQQRWLL